jgi:hypothetical protein
MFDDLPMMLRRSSVVDKYHKQHRQQRQQKKTDKFLRRLSRPFQLTHQHEDSIQYPQQTVPPSPKSTSPSRLSARFGLSPRVGRSKSNTAQTALVVPNNNNHTSTAGGQGGCGMQ